MIFIIIEASNIVVVTKPRSYNGNVCVGIAIYVNAPIFAGNCTLIFDSCSCSVKLA